MADRTKRGEEDRKNEDKAVNGQPVATESVAGAAATQGMNTSREKGREPADDPTRNDTDANR